MGNLDRAILSVPLILSFFLLVGMRVIFAVPVDLDSNWLFRIAPIRRARNAYAGVRRFLIFAIIIPIYVLAGLFYGLIWGWDAAVLHICFGATMSLLLTLLLFYRFPKIPFTCSYLPSAARSIFLYPFYYIGFASFAYAAAHLEAWLAHNPHRFLYFYGVAAALAIMLIRQTGDPDECNIRYEEQSETAPIYLDLGN